MNTPHWMVYHIIRADITVVKHPIKELLFYYCAVFSYNGSKFLKDILPRRRIESISQKPGERGKQYK